MSNPFDFLDTGAKQRCCLCSKKRLVVRVTIDRQTYGFCPVHEHRGTLLERGQVRNWPSLRIEGVTGTYAMDSDCEAWLLTAISGTDERVVELLDALDEHEETQQIA